MDIASIRIQDSVQQKNKAKNQQFNDLFAYKRPYPQLTKTTTIDSAVVKRAVKLELSCK
jgi:hypothetical protein